MYNIYYLLRRGRGTNQVVEALVRFMTAFYSEPELVNIFQQITAEESAVDEAMRDTLERALALLPAATSPVGGSRRTAGSFRSTSRELVRESQEAARAGSRFPRIEGKRAGPRRSRTCSATRSTNK